ncbi:hypothetical protein L1887_60355 [Cichorium endivia]|nr:hypothetical protein L1887_60355 [Cichorium endivia]
MGGKCHLRLNIGERPIANKYSDGKMKRTLKRELNSQRRFWALEKGRRNVAPLGVCYSLLLDTATETEDSSVLARAGLRAPLRLGRVGVRMEALAVMLGGTASSADLGGSSKYSNSHCPYLLSSETTAKGTGLAKSAGKEDPKRSMGSAAGAMKSVVVSKAVQLLERLYRKGGWGRFESRKRKCLRRGRHGGCRISGSFGAGEIPLPPSSLYLSNEAELGLTTHLLDLKAFMLDPNWRHCQVGSLAGAAHLLNDNAGVLRGTHGEQKSPVEQKGCGIAHSPDGEARARGQGQGGDQRLGLCALPLPLPLPCLCVRVSIWLGRDLLFEAGPSKQALG